MEKDFPLWLGARFFSYMARLMISTVVAWQIYVLTKDPLALGFIGLSEALPFLSLSLLAGDAADRHEKRKIMLIAETGLFLSAAALFVISFLDNPPLFIFYLVIALVGVCASFDSASSSAFAYTIIPKVRYSRAAAMNLTTFQSSIIAGPVLGGWVLSHSNAQTVYMLAGIFSLVACFLKSRLTPLLTSVVANGVTDSISDRVISGLKFIRSERLILACMSLDMVAVLFGDAVALFPIFADRFGAGPMGYGFLRAAPAIGSGLLSLAQTYRPFIVPSWKSLRMTVLAFGVTILSFALAPNIELAFLFLTLGGVADGISVIARQSVYQALTPDMFRGRVAAVSGIFIKTSNEIGAFESGAAARLLGVVPSVLFGGAVTLLSVLVFGRIFKDVSDKSVYQQ